MRSCLINKLHKRGQLLYEIDLTIADQQNSNILAPQSESNTIDTVYTTFYNTQVVST